MVDQLKAFFEDVEKNPSKYINLIRECSKAGDNGKMRPIKEIVSEFYYILPPEEPCVCFMCSGNDQEVIRGYSLRRKKDKPFG